MAPLPPLLAGLYTLLAARQAWVDWRRQLLPYPATAGLALAGGLLALPPGAGWGWLGGRLLAALGTVAPLLPAWWAEEIGSGDLAAYAAVAGGLGWTAGITTLLGSLLGAGLCRRLRRIPAGARRPLGPWILTLAAGWAWALALHPPGR